VKGRQHWSRIGRKPRGRVPHRAPFASVNNGHECATWPLRLTSRSTGRGAPSSRARLSDPALAFEQGDGMHARLAVGCKSQVKPLQESSVCSSRPHGRWWWEGEDESGRRVLGRATAETISIGRAVHRSQGTPTLSAPASQRCG